MATKWNEKLEDLSAKLDELSQKAKDAAGDAKAYHELAQEVIEAKISSAKGDLAAMQENARLAQEEQGSKIRSALLKARMTAKAKIEDLKDAHDQRALENFMDSEILYILDCYNTAAMLITDAQLSFLQVADALQEYEERFGGETAE
ncbi:MAG: hypothetical protein IK127_00325 [Clostridia bacterium]|nr:hypothetical protein [Clostridia bacterium]